MITCCMICRNNNDDYYHKGRDGGGQRDTIEIIISENDDNDGRPRGREWLLFPLSVVSMEKYTRTQNMSATHFLGSAPCILSL